MKLQIKTLFTSLWFKVVGTFILILLFLSLSLLTRINSITTAAFDQYLVGRSAYIEDVVPSLLPPRNRITIIPPIPEIPTIPAIPDRSLTVVGPNGEVIVSEIVEPVIVEAVPPETMVEELVSALTPSDVEVFSVVFLQEVRHGVTKNRLFRHDSGTYRGHGAGAPDYPPAHAPAPGGDTLAQGDLSVRVPIKSRDEIGRVAESFNQMGPPTWSSKSRCAARWSPTWSRTAHAAHRHEFKFRSDARWTAVPYVGRIGRTARGDSAADPHDRGFTPPVSGRCGAAANQMGRD